MDYLTIGTKKVSRLCFGCEQLGLHNWGTVDEKELKASVRFAVERGINFFDTADVYGMGTSEKNLSDALGADINEVFIATKFGIRFANGKRYFDNSPEWIKEALEASLKRLNRDYIDLYIMHYWDKVTPFEVILSSLLSLQERGKIKRFGFSNLDSLEIENIFAQKSEVFSYEYSLVNRQHESVINSLISNAVFMAYGVLGQGILSGKYKSKFDFADDDRRASERYVNFHGEKLVKNLEIIDRLTIIAKKYNVGTAQVALRWVLDRYENSVGIVGIKTREQVEINTSIFDWKLTKEDLNTLDKISIDGTL